MDLDAETMEDDWWRSGMTGAEADEGHSRQIEMADAESRRWQGEMTAAETKECRGGRALRRLMLA